MKSLNLQLALHEWRSHLRAPMAIAILMAVAVLMGLSGPFETYSLMPLIPRIGYWMVIVWGTYGIGSFVVILMSSMRGLGKRAGMASAAGINGILLTAFVVGFTYAAIGTIPNATVILSIVLIAVIVTALLALRQPTPESQPRHFIDRLPYDKRGSLISLSVTDHYVEALTTKGKHLVLIRFADAIAETAAGEGLQIHRSHWVARGHIKSVLRDGDRLTILTSANTELPVSRSYRAALKEAGIT